MSDDNAVKMVAGILGMILLGLLVIVLLVVITKWVIYAKAGKPGWAAIIPIYNLIVELEIVGRPLWWIALMFIPLVNFIVGIIITIDLAKSFGRGSAFAVGLIFLPFIFYPILAFGDSKYQGPAVAQA